MTTESLEELIRALAHRVQDLEGRLKIAESMARDHVEHLKSTMPPAANPLDQVPEAKYTPEYIISRMSARGGFTRKTLAELGVPWPPPKGWREKLQIKPARAKPEALKPVAVEHAMPAYDPDAIAPWEDLPV